MHVFILIHATNMEVIYGIQYPTNGRLDHVKVFNHILAHLWTNFFNGTANCFLQLRNSLWIIGIHFPFQKTLKEEVQRR